MLPRILQVTATLFLALCLFVGQAHAGSMTLLGVGKPAAAAGGSTVLIDTSAVSVAGTNAATSDSFSSGAHGFSLNIGSGPNGTTNRLLAVWLFFEGANSGTSTSPSATWHGVSMGSPVAGPFNNGTTGDIYLFCLPNPDTGANILAVSWTGANQAAVAAISVVSADQTGGTTSCRNATSAGGSGVSASVGVTTVSGDMVYGGFMAGGSGFTTNSTGTDIGHSNTGNFFNHAADCSGNGTTCIAASGASDTRTYGLSSSSWVAAGVSIKSN